MITWAVKQPDGDVLPFSIAQTEAQAQDLAAAQMQNSWAGLKAAGYWAVQGRFISNRALALLIHIQIIAGIVSLAALLIWWGW